MIGLNNIVKGMTGKLTLLLLSTVSILIAVEWLAIWLTTDAEDYPGVIYHTDDSEVELWCYDDKFNGTADWDLRLDHPLGTLRYAANINDDPRLEELDPRAVYNAVEVRLNELQFRERSESELMLELAREIPFTLIVGDSFCFGQGVRRRDRFSDLIEEKLEAQGQDHILYNSCVPGMNIQRIARVQREAVKRFGVPQRVVYSFTLNDPVRDAQTRMLEDSIYDLMHFRHNRFEAKMRSLLWRSATLRWLGGRRAREQIAERTVAWYQQLYEDNPGWRQTARILAEMKAFSTEKRIEFALVVFPLFHQLEDYPLRNAHQKLANFSRENGIEYIDLLDLFAGKDERQYWVHPTDFHPNDRAHREVAAYLQKTLDW